MIRDKNGIGLPHLEIKKTHISFLNSVSPPPFGIRSLTSFHSIIPISLFHNSNHIQTKKDQGIKQKHRTGHSSTKKIE